MSQENVEVILGVFEAVGRGAWDDALAPFDPDVVLDQTRMPDGGVYHGLDDLRRFFTRWFGAWEGLSIENEQVIDCGNRVIAITRLRGRGRHTGADVSMLSANIYTLRETKIIRHEGYPNAREALKAAGLAE
jgi:ketosteroid isomerase-like protein